MQLQAYYHVWEQNHWREVLLEHFRILQRQQFAGEVTIGFIGTAYADGFIWNMLEAFGLRGHVHHWGDDGNQFEFPTMKLLQSAARSSPKDRYLYFHTKGVSRPNDWVTCNWRWYMNAQVLGQLSKLKRALEKHDIAGASWGSHCDIGPHYPGNYWMARGDYLATLPDFDEHVANAYDWLERPEVKQHSFIGLRHAAETWLGQGEPRVYDCGHTGFCCWQRDHWVATPAMQQHAALAGT